MEGPLRRPRRRTPVLAGRSHEVTVIGVFLGTRPSTGYHVEIARIDRDGDALVVTWREKKPGPGEMAAQMITMPYVLVTIDRFTGPIKFVRAQ
jgi:hypothetical protein